MNLNLRIFQILGMICFISILSDSINAQINVFSGADENTPSRSQYFSWINNLNEGPTEEHTRVNLEFFKWLKDEYGMQLEIYAFDAGTIDGANFYGSIYSDRFSNQFPNGFDPIYKQAKSIGIRLGVWGGPDGFGDTMEEEKARIAQMVKLCRDYEFALFKFDAVCGPLRPEKEDAFIRMMKECRSYSPNLILLNHRLGLKKSKPYATTFLWEGQETYIDIHIANNTTAPHHRAAALSRGLPTGLKRLTEDHGVCISSCLDNWDDDLILQAFNRNLILAPQIYGNPWLLKDDEFPKLARIYNLHRKYRDIMTDALVLPENKYGPYAVSRGNTKTRLLTFRNLTWEPVIYKVALNSEIGLNGKGTIHVRKFHPGERVIGDLNYGEEITITVPPFKSYLLLVTSENCDEPAVVGCDYEVVKNIAGKPIEIKILGLPGTSSDIKLKGKGFKSALLDGESVKQLPKGKQVTVNFSGERLNMAYHRKLIELQKIDIPEDAEELYEATCYAADNNALEIRSLHRSGETNISQVKAARDAFFNQKIFRDKGLWDRFLFDNNLETSFFPTKRKGKDFRVNGGCFRLDLGKVTNVDYIEMVIPDIFSLLPLEQEEGVFVEVSKDLKEWETITVLAKTNIRIPINRKIRYLRMKTAPSRISEIYGFKDEELLARDNWRASNLFAHPANMPVKNAWGGEFIANEFVNGTNLCVAIEGIHGVEGAYAALRVGNELVGAADRAVSYPSNVWENEVAVRDRNYTYYFPMKKEYEGRKIELVTLGFNENASKIKPVVWQTTNQPPYISKTLILQQEKF